MTKSQINSSIKNNNIFNYTNIYNKNVDLSTQPAFFTKF